jgi:hypothetical protein
MSAPHVTVHAHERGRERLGLSRAAVERTAAIALRDGITRGETSGSLRRYLDAIVIEHGKGFNLRLHGHQVYIFEGQVLITILQLQARWYGTVDKLARQREAAG